MPAVWFCESSAPELGVPVVDGGNAPLPVPE
jgi:hypothetical protein